jgi:phage terminase small subunit
MEDLTKLTAKQQLFCEFYIGAANGNATEAARLAGYKGSDETLRAIGSQNLTKLNISEFCQERVNEVALSADKVLSELSEIALSKVEATRDRLTALQLLGKYHKLFSERLDLNVQAGNWRDEVKKYGLSEIDIINEAKLLIAESALESGDAGGN